MNPATVEENRIPVPPPQGARPWNLFIEWMCRVLFRFVRMDPDAIERIRSLSRDSGVVYVLRHRSWLDYLLTTWILKREGLPVPVFVNDGSLVWLRPIRGLLAAIRDRLTADAVVRRDLREFEDREHARRLVEHGLPILLFMRGGVSGVRVLNRRRRVLTQMNMGSDYLREIVHHLWNSGQDVSLVPIAVFRGRGMRGKDARMRTVVYSLQEVQTELRRLGSLLWNNRDTSIRVGGEVRLRKFIEQYQAEGEERLVRRLGRALQIFLYREERLVWGPPLLPKRVVRQRILEDDDISCVVGNLAREKNEPEAQLWKQAAKYFDEMAANFHGFYFSIIEFLFNRIWPRVFSGLEYSGLEKVVECVKQHPVVLVPCHRSHFDYLILSYIFHLNYLSPPHIAAGINLSFWPLGPLFRGAGAYFIRRSFEGNVLYRAVFRSYLTFLIREGYTQEFFIEGGRSRTGKILTPKLGVLTAIVEAFIQGIRRDLYFVPVSIQYGRVVEEGSYQRELGGGAKERESLLSLLKARSVLRQRHGTAYVTFGEPISLNGALGERKEFFHTGDESVIEPEKRRFIQKLGFRILRDVNEITVVGATSVTATVLLSLRQNACRHREFVRRARLLVDFLKHRNIALSASLERNAAGGFHESLGFLSNGGLIQSLSAENETVIHVLQDKRLGLDFYKNNTIHFFLLPALFSDVVSRGLADRSLNEEVTWWLDLFRWEFPLPEKATIAAELDRLHMYLREQAGLAEGDATTDLVFSPFVEVARGILDNFRESYWVTAQALMVLPAQGVSRKVLIDQIQRRYRTGLLLGEVLKPEGASSVTISNALSRYEELECLSVQAGKGRDKIVLPGRRFDDLGVIAQHIRASLVR